ncbi:MAG TPA: dTDP-4-dehydrorhamnose 3,5-epimerase [Bacteroidales bacterium]|nr:dTDP-4-dehydrorhamnose 3,5-epimerase [Bacteroidales bacterium]
MRFTETPLKGAYIIDLNPISDERGMFMRTYCKNEFAEIGHDKEFVQFNQSVTRQTGTIRGMHYQVPPFSEIKLLRCIRGSVFDVIIDLRQDSPTFLQYFSVELSERNMLSLYIPQGFAHGFQTLEDNTQLIYHHSAFYTPGFEAGIRYNDPAIGINWPLSVSVITEKDKNHPLLNNTFKGITL